MGTQIVWSGAAFENIPHVSTNFVWSGKCPSFFFIIDHRLLNIDFIQNCIYQWVREHRVHHKFSETDADPHNTKRGFFFAHVGWSVYLPPGGKKLNYHPQIGCLENDIQRYWSKLLNSITVMSWRILSLNSNLSKWLSPRSKTIIITLFLITISYFWPLWITFSIILPVSIPMLFWHESLWISVLMAFWLRYVLTLHCTWFVNSAAHMFGEKPYNDKIAPVDNFHVSFVSYGEGNVEIGGDMIDQFWPFILHRLS